MSVNMDINNPLLKAESQRQETYKQKKWLKTDIVAPEVLANDGFVYLGEGDMVQCVFCEGKLRAWQPGCVPREDHERYFPCCPFVLGYDVGNVPTNRDHRRNTTLSTFQYVSAEWIFVVDNCSFNDNNNTTNNTNNIACCLLALRPLVSSQGNSGIFANSVGVCVCPNQRPAWDNALVFCVVLWRCCHGSSFVISCFAMFVYRPNTIHIFC